MVTAKKLSGFGPFLGLMCAKAGAFILRICIKCYCCATFFSPAINYILAIRISIIYERVKHDTSSNNYTHPSGQCYLGQKGGEVTQGLECCPSFSLKGALTLWIQLFYVQCGLSTFSGLKVQVLKYSYHQMSVRFCGFYYMTITTITDI